MEQILPKIPEIVCYTDDILVTGRSDNDKPEHLEAVFKSLRQYGFSIKRTNCWFFQDSVEYLGSIVSKERIQTSKKQIEAILKVKTPTNQSTELKSFLGMVNHYGKCIRRLADLGSPLSNLLNKDVQWNWSAEFCEDQRDPDINIGTCPFQP